MQKKSSAAQALIDGAKIVQTVLGREDGAPVVVIHSGMTGVIALQGLSPHLVAAGMHTHMCDLSTCRTPAKEIGAGRAADEIRLVQRLMGEWRLRAAHIVACGRAAQTAIRLAAISPAHVRSLTLIDPPCAEPASAEATENWLISTTYALARRAGVAVIGAREALCAPGGAAVDVLETELVEAMARIGKRRTQIICGLNGSDAWPRASRSGAAVRRVPTRSGSALRDAPEQVAAQIAALALLNS